MVEAGRHMKPAQAENQKQRRHVSVIWLCENYEYGAMVYPARARSMRAPRPRAPRQSA